MVFVGTAFLQQLTKCRFKNIRKKADSTEGVKFAFFYFHFSLCSFFS
jgi:hypothetical protein